jgi:hypothetical protein
MSRDGTGRDHPDDEDDDHDHRMTVNLIAGIACLLLLGAGLFLMESLDRARKAEACLEAGRQNCPSIQRMR